MENKPYLTFSLLIDATEPLAIVRDHVQSALNCTLTGGSFSGVPAFVGETLGIRIGLLPWRGLGGAPVFELHGFPDEREVRGLAWEEIRIDQLIIDLLKKRGAGEWRQPSREEKIAAGSYDLEDI